jgi:hypothetical protein
LYIMLEDTKEKTPGDFAAGTFLTLDSCLFFLLDDAAGAVGAILHFLKLPELEDAWCGEDWLECLLGGRFPLLMVAQWLGHHQLRLFHYFEDSSSSSTPSAGEPVARVSLILECISCSCSPVWMSCSIGITVSSYEGS